MQTIAGGRDFKFREGRTTIVLPGGATLLIGNAMFAPSAVKGNVVRTNVYHKYIKDLKLNITIDLDGFIY